MGFASRAAISRAGAPRADRSVVETPPRPPSSNHRVSSQALAMASARRGRPSAGLAVVANASRSATQAGLRYVSDAEPGIRRLRVGERFVYVDPRGKRVRDSRELRRIRGVVIPPAWTNVWICPRADGHLQAAGRDARGRKQYRYHPRWRAFRDRTKYDRMLDFAAALPRIRRRLRRDMSRPGLCRERVLATLVQLLELTQIRIGNEEYARANRSYGLTTFRNRHVEVSATRLRFRFRGKSGKFREIEVTDRRVARVVRRCQEIPGQELFQYVDAEGETRSIDSGDVNDYIREISGGDFTAKDFRTWDGTVCVATALARLGRARTENEARKHVVEAVAEVAARLGNTAAVCRKSYIHPHVLDRYLEGQRAGASAARAAFRLATRRWKNPATLRPEETVVVALLKNARRRRRKGPTVFSALAS
jgi:DNA topoisomerase I